MGWTLNEATLSREMGAKSMWVRSMRRPASVSASPAQRISLSGENVTPHAGDAEPALTRPERDPAVRCAPASCPPPPPPEASFRLPSSRFLLLGPVTFPRAAGQGVIRAPPFGKRGAEY